MGDAAETGQVLVVDDDRAVGVVLKGLLSQAGHRAEHVTTAQEALARVASSALDLPPVDVVLTDLRMPGMDGMALLDALAERAAGVPVIMLTAHGTVERAVEAMKRGAADFLSKPFDRDEVLYTVDKALRASRYAAEQPAGPTAPTEDAPWLGGSDAMKEVAQLIARAAKASSTVLIRGESGSGKEVAARAIHAASNRKRGPFVPVHCAALPENLLESELFGYEKGAFTGATHRKPGRVELASGGTLFLDEIPSVPLGTQAKLLTSIEEKACRRIGGRELTRLDVQIIAAAQPVLRSLVKSGDFREDLYHRLNVIRIELPPLRERGEDAILLARAFVEELSREYGIPPRHLSADAEDFIHSYHWPGNVRE
ncbi:MAG TPA: two-component system response regulator, partial [Myxococcales bacterium]|nr:two-component system response regulator [Myxococcales bacterium]